MSIKKLISTVFMAAFAFGSMFQIDAQASDFPNKPIKIVVAGNAGGGLDLLARQIAPLLSKELNNVNIVILNKAAGNVTANEIIKGRHDGYTLGMSGSPLLTTSHFFAKVNYKYEDLIPIGQIQTNNFGFYTNVDKPWKNFNDVIATAKAENRPIQVGSFNTDIRISLESLSRAAGVEFVIVPMQSDSAMIPAILGNHIDLGPAPAVFSDTVIAGKTKMIGSISPTRFKDLPNIPTIKEQGFDFTQLESHSFLLAPGKTPQEVIDVLDKAFQRMAATPEYKKIIENAGATPATLKSTAETQALVKTMYENARKAKELEDAKK